MERGRIVDYDAYLLKHGIYFLQINDPSTGKSIYLFKLVNGYANGLDSNIKNEMKQNGINYVPQDRLIEVLGILSKIEKSAVLSFNGYKLDSNNINKLEKYKYLRGLTFVFCHFEPCHFSFKYIDTSIFDLSIVNCTNSEPWYVLFNNIEIRSTTYVNAKIIAMSLSVDDWKLFCSSKLNIKELYVNDFIPSGAFVNINHCDALEKVALIRSTIHGVDINYLCDDANLKLLELHDTDIDSKTIDYLVSNRVFPSVKIYKNGILVQLRQEKSLEKEENDVKSNH